MRLRVRRRHTRRRLAKLGRSTCEPISRSRGRNLPSSPTRDFREQRVPMRQYFRRESRAGTTRGMRTPPVACGALVAGWLALASPARAQAPATVNVSVDATADGTPLERVWPFYGYDEINY